MELCDTSVCFPILFVAEHVPSGDVKCVFTEIFFVSGRTGRVKTAESFFSRLSFFYMKYFPVFSEKRIFACRFGKSGFPGLTTHCRDKRNIKYKF